MTQREVQEPSNRREKYFALHVISMDEPQFRHAACLIAPSIVTDVLMMLGLPRRTSNPGRCVGAL